MWGLALHRINPRTRLRLAHRASHVGHKLAASPKLDQALGVARDTPALFPGPKRLITKANSLSGVAQGAVMVNECFGGHVAHSIDVEVSRQALPLYSLRDGAIRAGCNVRMDNPQDVGKRLAWARRRAGLSQQALADAAGMSFQAVSAWENGRNKTIKSQYLLGLTKALNIDIRWLLSNEGSPDPLQASLTGSAASSLSEEQQALIANLVESLKQ